MGALLAALAPAAIQAADVSGAAATTAADVSGISADAILPPPTPLTANQTLYLDVALKADQEIGLAGLPEEAAIYPISGELEIDGVPLALHTMALLDTRSAQRVLARSAAQFVVVGGEPLDGRRYMFWNFVSSRKERVVQAGEDWEAMRFAQVPGETERIPLPKRPADKEPTPL
jgi:redox-sensitive bicupin YhaK (pirin superfamily)